jgi:Lipocalin-like domain
MKNIIITACLLLASTTINNAQSISNKLKAKAKDASANAITNKTPEIKKEGLGKSATSKDTKGMEGTWKVDGVIVTTENEGMKSQIAAQEQQYNDAYKGSTWVFKKDGSIAITLPKSASSPGGTGNGQYELNGEKILMQINNQPNEYDLKFEDGQMLLINVSTLNTVYFVFVK